MAETHSTEKASNQKRPYLNKARRKAQLLESATLLVQDRGWPNLNMSTLAEQAGVSRQLVYQHFPSLSRLLTATATFIFADAMQGTQQVLVEYPTDMRAAVKAATRVTLDLPTGKADALWQLLAGLNSGLPELETISRGIRDLVIDMWLPMASAQLGLEPQQLKPLVWMLIMSFWGMRNLVKEGVVEREVAEQGFYALVDQVIGAPQTQLDSSQLNSMKTD